MKRTHRGAAPERPGPDWPVAALAAAGLLVSAYLTATKLLAARVAFCEAGGGCEIVQASRYAWFLGLPTAAWGVVFFAAVGALALLGLSPRRWLWAFGVAVSGVAFGGYLTWIELGVLRAICGWCLTVAVLAAATLGMLLWRRPPVTGRRSPGRPARLAALGVTLAVVTVIGAVGGHVQLAGSPGGREDVLARHLAAIGAIFYGAYW